MTPVSIRFLRPTWSAIADCWFLIEIQLHKPQDFQPAIENQQSTMLFLACPSCKRQQRDIARLLDRRRQPVLVRSAHARQTPRHDLAALGHELPEQPVVLVVDVFDLLDAELTYFLAPEEFA